MKQLLSILFLSLSLTVFAQQKDSTKNFRHEVGFHVGSTSGMGPTYRIWYKKIGLQASFLAIGSNHQYNSLTLYSGLSLNYLIQQNKFVDLYAFASSALRSNKGVACYIEPWLCPPTSKFQHSLNFGTGLGFDFKFAQTMILSTQVGYGMYNINHSLNGNIAGGISLLYKL